MPRSIITLTTDFGLADHFVGTMKGVILRIHPSAQIVDLGHQVSAFNTAEGGYLVAQAYRYFPPKTVHVVVVDPGVGTSRRPILAEAAGQYFVAPDNGVLTMIYAREKHKVRWITADRYFLKPVSQTFHGRDIFAPVGAHLAKGVAPAKMGRLIQDYLRSHSQEPVQIAKRGWMGQILKIDHFGNLITNFRAEDFPNLETGRFELTAGPHIVTRIAHNYAECNPGELFLIAGSSGYFEISASHASAARMLGCGVGAPVELALL